MRKWTWLLSLLLVLFSTAPSAAGKALVLTIDGPISPATQDYIKRGLSKAANDKVDAVIINMNTPGGLETSMRGINRAIISSPIPVLTYVTPAGARAASAGTFILYASHIAAMAPGTNLGAASPVSIGGTDEKKDNSKQMSTMEKKSTNDAAAYIRSLAELRGRNIKWAESAVRNAASLSASEAVKQNVINFIADNHHDLLQKANGRKVMMLGAKQILNTKDLTTIDMPPDWRSEFLAFITNPNIAYLFMLAALYGLFFEFSNPGAVIPGVIGVIALLLALYAFQLMPVNYTGLLLVVVGIGFMITEFYIASFGVIGIGGIIAFAIGSVMLFDTRDANYQLAWSLIGAMSIISALFFFIIFNLAIRSHKMAIVSGKEALIDAQGVVLSVMNEQVVVRVAGEIWEAHSSQMLNEGDKVRVVSANGLHLEVERLNKD